MNKLQLIDADTLYYKPLAHPKMLIDGVLSDGLAILAGDSKIGKSWMVLDLCLAVAQGEPFLGFPTRQHGTLYLALEDGKSRMQTRLRRLLEGRPAPANMHVMFQAQRLGGNAGGVSGCQPGHPSGLHRYLIQDQAQGKAL